MYCMSVYSVRSYSLQPHGLYVACQAPLSMEFYRQEHWSGLLCPPPGDLPDPGIKPVSLMSPALAGKFFTTEPPGKPRWCIGGGQKQQPCTVWMLLLSPPSRLREVKWLAQGHSDGE